MGLSKIQVVLWEKINKTLIPIPEAQMFKKFVDQGFYK